MASPHAAGVAALIISVIGKAGGPSRVAALLGSTADPQVCPKSLPGPTPFSGGATYEELGASVNNDAPPVCTGGKGNTSWYGAGEVDAYNAVTRNT